jgi:DNA ligase-1
LQDFLNKKSKNILSQRIESLKKAITDNKFLHVLEQTVLADKDHFCSMLKDATVNNWEGLMIRKDASYEGKRSKNLLKCKNFFDDEYTVVSTENGPFHVVLDGKEVEEDMLSCVTVMHKGYPVRVGSGWSVEQRRKYFKNSNLIIGKKITVQYFAESFNEKGEISLRFPTIKCVHGEERDT